MIPEHRRRIDAYWAAEMAMPPHCQSPPQGIEVSQQELYPGVQFFLREDWLMIAAPPEGAHRIAASVRGLPPREVFDVEFVRRWLCPGGGEIIGPAQVSYADQTDFCPTRDGECRLLTEENPGLLQEFASTLTKGELEQSGFDVRGSPAFGSFADGCLASVASYKIWEPHIAHITVATHPDYRRRGYAGSAVTALADHAFTQGLILQYRALAVNVNSLSCGRSLGFRHYCSTIYARPA